MRVGTLIQQAHASVISLGIVSPEFDETGAAIVLSVNPLRLLVPSHLVLAIEDGSAVGVTLDGSMFRDVTLLCSPVLERHELRVLQINQTAPRHLRPMGPVTSSIDTFPGQIAVLVSPRSLSSNSQSGPLLTTRSDGHACMATLAVSVGPGDSGSAVLIHGRLAGVVQGMRASESGASHAIAVLLSEQAKQELQLISSFRRPRPYRSIAIPLVAAASLVLLSAPLSNQSVLSSSEASVLGWSGQGVVARTEHHDAGAMPHAIELFGSKCLIAQIDTGAVLEFDRQTGILHELARSLDHPCDMAATDGNSVLCVNEEGALMEIDAATGQRIADSLLQDRGLMPDDIVMGIDASSDSLGILFYRDGAAYIMWPEAGEPPCQFGWTAGASCPVFKLSMVISTRSRGKT